MNIKPFVVKCTYEASRVRERIMALQAIYTFKYSNIVISVRTVFSDWYSDSKMEKQYREDSGASMKTATALPHNRYNKNFTTYETFSILKIVCEDVEV